MLKTFYVLSLKGEFDLYTSENLEDVLDVARDVGVTQHLHPAAPPATLEEFNLRVFKTTEEVELPLQEWVDAFYQQKEAPEGKEKTFYVLSLLGGHDLHTNESLEDVLAIAHDVGVVQHLVDHHREVAPPEATPEEFDLRVFKATEEVELPLQEWVDAFYQERDLDDEELERKEKKELTRLLGKYGSPIWWEENKE